MGRLTIALVCLLAGQATLVFLYMLVITFRYAEPVTFNATRSLTIPTRPTRPTIPTPHLRPVRGDFDFESGCLALPPRFRKTAEQYAALHRRITQAPATEDRILVIHSTGGFGFGNWLFGTISGMLIAIMSNRAFYIDFRGSQPPPLKPCGFNWTWDPAMDREMKTAKTHAEDMNYCFLYHNSLGDMLLRAESLDDRWPESRLYLLSNCPIFAFIARNKKFAKQLADMGLVDPGVSAATAAFQVAGPLIRLLFGLEGDALVQVHPIRAALRQ